MKYAPADIHEGQEMMHKTGGSKVRREQNPAEDIQPLREKGKIGEIQNLMVVIVKSCGWREIGIGKLRSRARNHTYNKVKL